VRFNRAQSAILQAVDARSKDRLFLTNTLNPASSRKWPTLGPYLMNLRNPSSLS
jgi:hypothetical protein